MLCGCYSEDDIVATEGSELQFTFPQGNHDYDDRIMAYYDKYGFYILYDFEDRELYWNNTQWDQSFLGTDKYTDGVQGSLLGEEADTLYVGKLLDLCENLFFRHYPDELLEQMPVQFLLCSELKNVQNAHLIYGPDGLPIKDEEGNYIRVYDTVRLHTYAGFNRFAVNGASAEIDTMGTTMKANFQRAVNSVILTYLNETKGAFEICEEFTEVSNYSGNYLSSGDTIFYRGFLNRNTLVNKNPEQTKINDIAAYLNLLAMPLEVLEGEPVRVSDWGNPPMEGMLNPKRDKYGLIRKKYDILIDYFRDVYGIDTEAWQHPSY